MSSVIEGKVFPFLIRFTNANGRVLDSPLPTDASATLDNPAAGTLVTNPDGSACTLTAANTLGTVGIIPAAGGFTGSPFPVDVTADPVPAGVVVVPVESGAPAGVTVVPA